MKKHSTGLVLVAGLALSVSAMASLTSTGEHVEIVGGKPVAADDPIAATTVVVYNLAGSLCTGSIIASDIIVTAAHCVSDDPLAGDYQIYFVTDAQNIAASNTRAVDALAFNPSYNTDATSNMGDIALVHIQGGLPTGYRPATLLSQAATQAMAKGQMVTLAGFGMDNEDAGTGVGTLREASVPILLHSSPTELVMDQSSGSGGCEGDSGGPAFVTENGALQLWGVTHGPYMADGSPANCHSKSIYTEIAPYLSWITQTEAKLRAGS